MPEIKTKKNRSKTHIMDESQLIIFLVKNLAVDLKSMPKGFLNYEHLLIATCEKTNFVYAVPLQNKKTQTIADALIHRVFFIDRTTHQTVYLSRFSTNIRSYN